MVVMMDGSWYEETLYESLACGYGVGDEKGIKPQQLAWKTTRKKKDVAIEGGRCVSST